MKRRTITPPQLAVLAELNRLGGNGGLTRNMARSVFGLDYGAKRVRDMCVRMAVRGLVMRRPENEQRWFITQAGRETIWAADAEGEKRA